MPVHFWSSFSPIATLSPHPGATLSPLLGASIQSAPMHFQFPVNGGTMFSPVVTVPNLSSSSFSGGDLETPLPVSLSAVTNNNSTGSGGDDESGKNKRKSPSPSKC